MSAAEPRRVDADAMHVEILADAFADDPFVAWIFGARSARDAALPTWWAFICQNTPEGAELWRIDDAAASLWHPPIHPGDRESGDDEATPDNEAIPDDEAVPDDGAPPDDEADAFVDMMTPFVGDRLPEILDVLGRGREHRPEEPHWYLLALGTRSSQQGHGHGARLVRPVLDRCDREGLVAYLESSNPRNIPFYHRLGFEIVNETWTPDDAAVVTGMRRTPR